MFSHIDSFLISSTQWTLRQVELFTKITRDGIMINLIKVGKLGENIMTLCLVPPHRSLQVEEAYKQQQKNNNILPKEIVTREISRGFVWIGFFIFLSLSPIFPTFLMNVFFYIFLIAEEYFLCTTSLPPGEKESREVDNKMLTPV